jgi:hypothetical protein
MRTRLITMCLGVLTILTAFATMPMATDVTGLAVEYLQFGSASGDEAWDLYVDETGAFIVGTTYGEMVEDALTGNSDVFVCMYDNDHALKWIDQFGTEGTTIAEVAFGIDVYLTGVYVIGMVQGTISSQDYNGGVTDIFLRKYNLDGDLIWTRLIGTDAQDVGRDVAVDDSGVYIVGSVYYDDNDDIMANGESDLILAKYGFDGTEVWTLVVGPDGELGTKLSLDSTYIYVYGSVENDGTYPPKPDPSLPNPKLDSHCDALVCKYEKDDGDQIWETHIGVFPLEHCPPWIVGRGGDHDSSGIYITGSISMGEPFPGHTFEGETTDAFLVKLDFDGSIQWIRQFGSSADDEAFGLKTTPTGIIVSGKWDDITSGFVCKYSSDGDEIWMQDITSDDPYSTAAWEVFATESEIYAVGVTYGDLPDQSSKGYADAFLMKITNAPCIDVTPMSLEFGDVVEYTTCTEIVTLSNCGRSDLTVDDISIADGSSSYFTIESAPTTPAVVEPGSTVDVVITFEPWNEGVCSGSLQITSDDPYNGLMVISLTGNGIDSSLPPSDTIKKAKEYLAAAVKEEKIVGNGNGGSASAHLDVFKGQLEIVDAMIAKKQVEAAISKIDIAINRADGDATPPDFIKGDGTKELVAQLTEVKEALQEG